MKKFFRIFILVVVALIFVWTFWFLYSNSQPKPVVYNIESPARKSLQNTSVATGRVEPRDEILIKPQISGIIDKLYKEAGDYVKKGEIIARVKVIPEMNNLNSAESRVRLSEINLAQTQREWNRTKKLFSDKLISKEEYEKAQVSFKQAQEEMQTAKDALEIIRTGVSQRTKNISNTNIRSTIDGLVLDVPVKEGNSVIQSNTFNEGTTIASVADMSNLIFKGNVDETEVGSLHEGMPMSLKIGAVQGGKFTASLEYISPKGVDNNGTTQFEIKAAIHVPDSVTIRSGYSANAEIVLRKVENALTVPEGLIEFKGDSTFVYKLTSKDPQAFERIPVKVGMTDGVNIQILSGLKGDEQLRGKVFDPKMAKK